MQQVSRFISSLHLFSGVSVRAGDDDIGDVEVVVYAYSDVVMRMRVHDDGGPLRTAIARGSGATAARPDS